MKRALLLSICTAVCVLAISAFAPHANAQANACCGFTITANMNIPLACFPIAVTTSWGNGLQSQTDNVNVRGTSGFTIVPCGTPPPTPFDWVSLDGGLTKILYNTPTQVNLPAPCATTCVTLIVTSDPVTGCIQIRLAGC
ncbi:MAG TPA: hypothetical protein VHI13_06150 [Candidatus Kapabacteria bacterium]|nr:hypothetical protein [Candidatus Kapabacteria bacterium]